MHNVGKNLWFGSLPTRSKLLKCKATAVVGCCPKVPDPHHVADVEYVRHVFPDSKKRIDLDTLALAVQAANQFLTDGHTLFVHCYGGRNRSALVTAICITMREGVSGRTAFERIRQHHPNSFTNELFVKYLLENYL